MKHRKAAPLHPAECCLLLGAPWNLLLLGLCTEGSLCLDFSPRRVACWLPFSASPQRPSPVKHIPGLFCSTFLLALLTTGSPNVMC